MIGVRVHMHEPDGLGPNTMLPDVYIEESMPNGDCVGRFSEPVVIDGPPETVVLLSPRHRGYPLSRVASGAMVAANAFLQQSRRGFIVTLKQS